MPGEISHITKHPGKWKREKQTRTAEKDVDINDNTTISFHIKTTKS